jgi:RNA polymerase sigma factor (sigma-70 family)
LNRFEHEKNAARRAARILLEQAVTDASLQLAGSILIAAYHELLIGFLIGRFRLDHADAEEITVTVFLKFLANPPTEPGAEQSWLFVTARHLALDLIRRRKAGKRGGGVKDQSIEEMNESETGAGLNIGDTTHDPSRKLALADCMEKAWMQIEIKAPAYRPVIEMIIDGMSTSEIAVELKISATAASSRVHEARKKAREIFKDCKE